MSYERYRHRDGADLAVGRGDDYPAPPIGAAVMTKYGWMILADLGIPSMARTLRPLSDSEWTELDDVLAQYPELRAERWIELETPPERRAT